eukprot:827882-Pyramimonas_sp.AAC.1
MAGDRLEPSRALPDARALECAALPITVTFWRSRRAEGGGKISDAVGHGCPLFSAALCASPHRTLAVDSLHTLFLGPASRCISACLRRVLLKNP